MVVVVVVVYACSTVIVKYYIRRAFNLSDVKLFKVKDHLAFPSVHLRSLKLEAD